jgi:RNA polymerase sigma-70 factor (ECF subfamily)
MAALGNDYVVGGEDNVSAEDQLVALMDRYEGPIYGYLQSLLRDRDAALDCAQDTFLRAYDAMRKGRAINRSWLFTVAHHRAVDEMRRRRRIQTGERVSETPSREGSTESTLELRDIIDSLPPGDREVLYLFEVAGFTTDEIGASLGIRGSAVRQRLVRARQRLRALYSPEPGETSSSEELPP